MKPVFEFHKCFHFLTIDYSLSPLCNALGIELYFIETLCFILETSQWNRIKVRREKTISCSIKLVSRMLQKFIILCCTLPLIRTQNDCASYWQYIKYEEEVQGLITIPSFNAQDHKLKINLIVAGKISSVSQLCYLFTLAVNSSWRFFVYFLVTTNRSFFRCQFKEIFETKLTGHWGWWVRTNWIWVLSEYRSVQSRKLEQQLSDYWVKSLTRSNHPNQFLSPAYIEYSEYAKLVLKANPSEETIALLIIYAKHVQSASESCWAQISKCQSREHSERTIELRKSDFTKCRSPDCVSSVSWQLV